MTDIMRQEWAARTSIKGQAANCEARQNHPANSASPNRKPSVLIIEDEELIRRLLVQGLKSRGFSVWGACDGNEGVQLYKQLGGKIDVVLSDLNMPVMDGPQAFDAIRQINPVVRWCFMTADARQSTLAGLLDMGALRVFSKPMPSVAEVADDLQKLAVRSPFY
jgi:CheY-like chemotaxis protein